MKLLFEIVMRVKRHGGQNDKTFNFMRLFYSTKAFYRIVECNTDKVYWWADRDTIRYTHDGITLNFQTVLEPLNSNGYEFAIREDCIQQDVNDTMKSIKGALIEFCRANGIPNLLVKDNNYSFRIYTND